MVTGKGDGFLKSALGIGSVLKRSANCPQRCGILDIIISRLMLFKSGDELICPVNDLLCGAGHQITSSTSVVLPWHELLPGHRPYR